MPWTTPAVQIAPLSGLPQAEFPAAAAGAPHVCSFAGRLCLMMGSEVRTNDEHSDSG